MEQVHAKPPGLAGRLQRLCRAIPLSFANAFHADPDWVDAYRDVYTTSYDDDDFLWVIDGYDFCNRMQDFAHGSYEEAQGSTPTVTGM
ncbi:MAG: hypothetical protein R3F28_12455 [Candidatus Kapaibacterium sp.]